MIPRTFDIENADDRACEEIIFNSLRDNLTENYFVYHSVKNTFRTKNKRNKEAEADFIIFDPKRGLIVVEAKHILGFCIDKGVWTDSNGNEIHYGNGPYNQVKDYVGRLKEAIQEKIPGIYGKFPITYIVWFHAMSAESLREFNTCSDFNFEHTFSKDDLANPLPRINKILKEQALVDTTRGTLTEPERKKLEQILNLEVYVFDYKHDVDEKNKNFNILLDEQKRILDFIEYQPTACIQGLGGTGKTVIAVEKAKRCSLDGRTLFLCFNSELRTHLSRENKDFENIDFQSVDSLMGKMTYSDLFNYILSDEFKYKNVIIDEAQDISHDIAFTDDPGKKRNLKVLLDSIFEAFKEKTTKSGGCFFVFFDKYQCIQSESSMLPGFIEKPDCLLTLHINCRNTIEICRTATAPLEEGYKGQLRIKHVVNKGVKGDKPDLFICANCIDTIKKVDSLAQKAIEKYGKNLVILTMKTLDTTLLNNSNKFNKYQGVFETEKGQKVKVSTIRKFKGLEADSIVLVDVSEKTFDISNAKKNDDSILMFYVGCSRAKFQLSIIGNIDQEKLQNILEQDYHIGDARKSFSELAAVLGTNSYSKV